MGKQITDCVGSHVQMWDWLGSAVAVTALRRLVVQTHSNCSGFLASQLDITALLKLCRSVLGLLAN